VIVFPAIDLKDGVCVRLLRGDMGRATVFNTDPAAQARDFAAAGFEWLHCVDLNGAVEGRPVNAAAIAAILAAAKVSVQLGGGIRDLATVERWLNAGVARIILSTVALEQPDLVKEACRKWPGHIAVGIDARGGLVAVEGWTRNSNVKALDLALRFEDVGVSAIIYTDIGRDGAMVGANVEATVDLAFALTTPVIASGGVASIADIVELKAHEAAGIAGVICGRALYDGRIDPAEALRVARG
jgi:phosphoribosylformimino-5-aminoimidazole carboxamide ribotide isomerase